MNNRKEVEAAALNWLLQWAYEQNTDAFIHYNHLVHQASDRCQCDFEGQK